MSDYRIEKQRRGLRLTLTDGSQLEGDVFLRPLSRFSRPEEPADLLNDDEPFFALVHDGQAMLIAKANVSRAVTSYVDGSEKDYSQTGEMDVITPGVSVEVTQNDGSVSTGSVFLEGRSDRPRLLDYLNAYRQRFLPVVDVRQVYLLNTNTIAHVREVG